MVQVGEMGNKRLLERFINCNYFICTYDCVVIFLLVFEKKFNLYNIFFNL